jgi:flagellar biosynthesis protein
MASSNSYFQAFALGLPSGLEAPPILTARGEYDSADHIVACARRFGVPVVERPEMCVALSELELDAEIPVELFEAAAALLAEIGAIARR